MIGMHEISTCSVHHKRILALEVAVRPVCREGEVAGDTFGRVSPLNDKGRR
jgi:hypothetical protein